ncbi:hypothetical protein F4860DRAFT_517614 [Xylaria cubensis]|nr:hypothetical protein F4860DRAFT_517614 [Xylaria cubensis]
MNMTSIHTEDSATQGPLEPENDLPKAEEGQQDKNDALELERSKQECLESELKEAKEESMKFQKRWKKAARDLNQYKTQERGIAQLTDDYLIDKANGLRYNIKNFAIQVGTETTPPALPPRTHGGPIEGDEMPSILSPETTSSLPRTDDTIPLLGANHCQAKIWRYLGDHVFGKFVWAMPIAQEILNIAAVLSSRIEDEQSANRVEKWRKLLLWRATTASLVLDASSPVEQEWHDRKWEMGQEIHKALGLTLVDDKGIFAQEIIILLDQAIDLDKDISRQATKVYWNFGDERNPESWHVDEAENVVRTIVIAPGMIRWGTSSGGHFDVQNELLPIEHGRGDERI